MLAIIIVGLVVGVPLFLATTLRVNATLLFVSVLSGSLLAERFGYDANLVVSSFIRSVDSSVVANLALLFLPVVLMIILARRTVTKSAALLQIVPLVAACVFLGITAVRYLPNENRTAWYDSQVGRQVHQSEDLIVGAVVLSQLMYIWATQRPVHHKKHRNKSH